MPRLLPTVAQPNPSAMSRSPEPAHNHVLETQPTHEREHVAKPLVPFISNDIGQWAHSRFCISHISIPTSTKLLIEVPRITRVSTPIHSLPTELIGDVLQLVYDSTILQDRIRSMLKAASVCRSWRDISIRMQSLWSTFDTAWSPDLANLVMSRAGNFRQLEVSMSTVPKCVADAAFPSYERWRFLHLECTPASPTLELFSNTTPNLHHLTSLVIDIDEECVPGATSFNIQNLLPNITHVHIINLPSPMVWTMLTTKLISLTFEMPMSERGFLLILDTCTSLEELYILSITGENRHVILAPNHVWQRSPICVPKSLRALVFLNVSAAYACHIVQHLEAPFLKELGIGTMYGVHSPMAALGNPGARRLCTFFAKHPDLTSFSVRCDMHFLYSLLKALIGGFSRDFASSGTLTTSLVSGEGQPAFLPRLVELGVNLTGLLHAGKPTAPTETMRGIIKIMLMHALSVMRVNRRHQDGETFKLSVLRIFGLNPSTEEMGVLQDYSLEVLHAGLPMRSMK